MANFRVDIARAAEKELDELPAKDRDRINARITALADDPRPYGYEQLSGEKKYRLRQGDFRIVYGIDDTQSVVLVIKIGHRRDVYR